MGTGRPRIHAGLPVADQPPRLSGQPTATAAAGQPKTAEIQPPDYSALPPAQDYSNADLAKRVSDLEKQLADYAKAAAAAKSQAPTKPLIAPSGRIQFDVANFTQNAASIAQFGNAQNTVGFRRARLALLGEYEQIDYIIEMDFANRGITSAINPKDQSTAFKDVYIQVRDLPVLGNVRVGHFKECFGLEDLTSDNYTTFMERSLDDEGAFVPGRNDGIMAYNWTENQRATWAIGAFTNQTGFDQPPTFIYDHWGLDMAMRATYLPWYDEASGGRGLLHTGIDYAYRSAPDHTMTFATRPESAFAPSVVNLTTDRLERRAGGWDAEAALVYGPFSMQSEFFAATVDHQSGAIQQLLRRLRLRQLLPHRREPAVQPEDGRVRPRQALRGLLPRADLRRQRGHRPRRLGTGLPLLLHRHARRPDDQGGRPGGRSHLRPELVPEPLHQGDVQLRAFHRHVQRRDRATANRAETWTSSRCGSPWISDCSAGTVFRRRENQLNNSCAAANGITLL